MKKQNSWFVLLLVVVVVWVILLWINYSLVKVQYNREFFVGAFDWYRDWGNNFEEDILLAKRLSQNTDSTGSDSLSCAWNLEYNASTECYDPLLPGYIALAGPWDSINDDWDNDDFRCQYFEDTEASKIDLTKSKDCDNDDEYRLELEWVVAPWQMKSVLVFDKDTIDMITANLYNSWAYVKRELPENNSFKVYSEVSSTTSAMHVYSVDKGLFDSSWEYHIDSSFSWNVLNLSWDIQNDWSLWSWNEFTFNTSLSYYVIMLENTWTASMTYKISAVNPVSWDSIYVAPIDDSAAETETAFKDIFIDSDLKLKEK